MGMSNQRNEEIRAKMAQAMRDEQAKAEALAIVALFNSRLEAKREPWFWPTIGAAILTKHHWMIVVCQSCETVADLDLRVKPRPPGATILTAFRDVRCPRCNGHGRPSIRKLARAPSPTTTRGWRD